MPAVVDLLLAGLALAVAPAAAPLAPPSSWSLSAQQTRDGRPIGRAALEAIDVPPLDFVQPEVDRHSARGVDVLMLEDRTLPLVTVHAYFRGGYGLFGREVYAAAMGLPALMRFGGTTLRTAGEVDERAEEIALQLSFGSGGGSVTSSINTLTEHLDEALELWGEMLARPGFAEDEIDAWRARQLETVLRRRDDPARLAYSEINRLLYGDHPVGWEMEPADLTPERVRRDRFEEVHRRVACRDNLVLGVTGDTSWGEIAPLLERLVDDLPACANDLPEGPAPDIRRAPGVFLIEKAIDQAVIVMAHPSSVRFEDDPRYFSAMIGNSILGGSGFSSRIMGRVRTEEGYAYFAASLWTTPRKHEGLIGATTRTRPERAAQAIEVILATMEDLRATAPTEEEVQTTVDQMVNGFVFNFDSPGQIVARSMYYLAQDLPEDWLERYLRGIREVSPDDVREVFAENLHPPEMTILIVGDPSRMDRGQLARLGPITVLEVR